MRISNFHFDQLNRDCRDFWEKLAPRCGRRDCTRARTPWSRLRPQTPGVMLGGARYCAEPCLERALNDTFQRLLSRSKPAPAPHRFPLGLLLLSRHQVTEEQLRTALEAQRVARHGRIGEWLRMLGFVSEQQVTAALARQWSCPLLHATFRVGVGERQSPTIPRLLLERFVMIPVGFAKATSTLYVAFGEGVDYNVLYAIEQMLGCRTEPCMAVPSFVHASLGDLSCDRTENEVQFERVADATEISRITRSYCAQLGISEIRLAPCEPYLWVRLLRTARAPLDLLLRSTPPTSLSAVVPTLDPAI